MSAVVVDLPLVPVIPMTRGRASAAMALISRAKSSTSPITGTPALLVLTADGKAVNLDTAASWRNAASRAEDAIFAELAALADQPAP